MLRLQHVLAAAALLTLVGCSHPANEGATSSASPTGVSTPGGDESPREGGHRRGGRRNREARYKKMFEEMDTNHDGQLSDAEKAAGLDKLLEKNERMFKRVDKDHDGKISPEEKAEFLKHFMEPPKPRNHEGSQSPSASPAEEPAKDE